MPDSAITINVSLDDERMPDKLSWSASDTSADDHRDAKAMLLSFWDGADKSALRIDLWTKEMMVDEMADFFFQTLMSMGDTYQRATRNEGLSNDIKKFAREFYDKFREQQLKEEGKVGG